MKCPIDETELMMTERHGVEIDYCPKCRGVWLDRGELDKIIEKSTVSAPSQSTVPPQPSVQQRSDHLDRRFGDQYGHKPKKKKSFLGEIFDF